MRATAVCANGYEVYALLRGQDVEAPSDWRVVEIGDPVFGNMYRIATPESLSVSHIRYRWPWAWVRATREEAEWDAEKHTFPIGAVVPFPLGGWVWVHTGGGYPEGCEAAAMKQMRTLEAFWSGKMKRKMVSMYLHRRTIERLRLLARLHGSQSNAVIDLVDRAFACPNCGNRDMDWLPWDEEADTVTCGKCGRTYVPGEAVDAGERAHTERI